MEDKLDDKGDYALYAPGRSLSAKDSIDIVRSPLFGTAQSSLLLLTIRGVAAQPGLRPSVAVSQLVHDTWTPVAILNSGGGSADEQLAHWVEFECLDKRATGVRLVYHLGSPIGEETIELPSRG